MYISIITEPFSYLFVVLETEIKKYELKSFFITIQKSVLYFKPIKML